MVEGRSDVTGCASYADSVERIPMNERIIADGITFDDVLLVPCRSDVVPRDVDTGTNLTRGVRLHIPIVSAAMDTVTDSNLAIALAQEGGVGILHKNMLIEDQVREVVTVKRSESGVITDPVTLSPDRTIGEAKELMGRHRISGVPIIQGEKLVGILTSRDLRFQQDLDLKVEEVMTKENLVTARPTTTLEEAKQVLHERKIEKLLLVDESFRLQGMITIKDINKLEQFPLACKDERGRLRAGAAIGVHDYERAAALVKADVDVLCVDTAHGHSTNVIETVRKLKKEYAIEVIAGNVATGEATGDLIEAGADAVKVGIGPGSICTTRMISGVGVPQISAIWECVRVAEKSGVPIIADGGIKFSGDITKAIAAGASSTMIGGLFAGLAEAPGETVIYKGRSFKVYRGMGSLGAMVAGSSSRYQQHGETDRDKLVPEGVEGRVPYRGRLAEYVYQLVGGLRAGMGYCGAETIDQLRTNARFMRISAAGLRESHPHDIIITSEAPNYRLE